MRTFRFLLPLALFIFACEPEPVPEPSLPRGVAVSPPAGQVWGPCLHDDRVSYHWCETSVSSPFPVVCSIPQDPEQQHATVCYERRPAGECPPFKEFFDEFGDLVEQPLGQDYANACALKCSIADDCPNAMLCSAGVCAHATFPESVDPDEAMPCCTCIEHGLVCTLYEDPETWSCPEGFSATLDSCVP